tara:strand:- start:6120 stop:6836 length:717 start_codon:yes stop_codon:yes gene_type:complete
MTRGGYIFSLIVVILLWGFREWTFHSEKKELTRTISSIQSFFQNERESFMDGKELIAHDLKEMKQLQVASAKEMEFLKEQYKSFSKIQSVIKAEITSSVKGLNIPIQIADVNFPDSLIPVDLVNQFYIPKNSKSSYSDDWIDLAFTIGDSLAVDSIKVRNKIDAVVGWKKSDKAFAFLRKKEPVVEIISYSPYTEIGHINNLTVKPENNNKFLSAITSKPVLFITGVIGGILVSNLIK